MALAGSKLQNCRGNIIVILAMMLTLLFVIAGIAIETTLYLLRRAELQSIAEGVSLGAVMSLPSKEATISSAQSWYNVLRTEGVREIAPAAAISTSEADNATLTVIFDDNASSAGENEPYLVNSITIKIVLDYQPKIFPVLGARDAYRVVGQATAQLRPTDVVMIVDNSGSFYEKRSFADDLESAGLEFADDQIELASQCYSPSWRNFKKGAVLLYDLLSQIGTFRVSVVTTTSRTVDPFVMLPLGTTKVKVSDLEYDADQPYHHSSYCAGLARTELPANELPTNPNDDDDNTWSPRSALDGLLVDNTFKKGDFQIKSDKSVLGREALWILKAGYLTSNFMHPKYVFTSPVEAAKLAVAMLTNSRRSDNLPVGQRAVLALMGSDGMSDTALGWGEDPPTADNLAEYDYDKFCETWRQNWGSYAKLGVLYFGHNASAPHHDPSTLDDFRSHCLIPGSENTGIFFGEVSTSNGKSEADFHDWLIPRVVHGLKQAELVQ